MTSPTVPAVERTIPPALVTRLGNPVLGWLLSSGPVPVQLTLLGRRVPATAVLEEDPLAVAEVYQRLIDEVGLAQAGQRLGIRINVDRAPTRHELVDAVRRERLSVVRLRTGDTR